MPTSVCSAEQAEFSEHHEAQVGNETIVKGLIELRKYWDALEGDFRIEAGTDDEDDKKTRTHSVNHGVCIHLATCPIDPRLGAVLAAAQHCSSLMWLNSARRPRVDCSLPPCTLSAMLRLCHLGIGTVLNFCARGCEAHPALTAKDCRRKVTYHLCSRKGVMEA